MTEARRDCAAVPGSSSWRCAGGPTEAIPITYPEVLVRRRPGTDPEELERGARTLGNTCAPAILRSARRRSSCRLALFESQVSKAGPSGRRSRCSRGRTGAATRSSRSQRFRTAPAPLGVPPRDAASSAPAPVSVVPVPEPAAAASYPTPRSPPELPCTRDPAPKSGAAQQRHRRARVEARDPQEARFVGGTSSGSSLRADAPGPLSRPTSSRVRLRARRAARHAVRGRRLSTYRHQHAAFVVVRASGPNPRNVLLHRTPGHVLPLPQQFPRRSSFRSSPEAANDANCSRAVAGNASASREGGLCGAVKQGGRYLGVIELATRSGSTAFQGARDERPRLHLRAFAISSRAAPS